VRPVQVQVQVHVQTGTMKKRVAAHKQNRPTGGAAVSTASLRINTSHNTCSAGATVVRILLCTLLVSLSSRHHGHGHHGHQHPYNNNDKNGSHSVSGSGSGILSVSVSGIYVVSATSSIPRSTNSRSYNYNRHISSSSSSSSSLSSEGATSSIHKDQSDDSDSEGDSNSNSNNNNNSNNSNNNDNNNNNNSHNSNNNHNYIPWNPSPKIDPDGFLTNSYKRIKGEWESEAGIGGRYADFTRTSTSASTSSIGRSQAHSHGHGQAHGHGHGRGKVKERDVSAKGHSNGNSNGHGHGHGNTRSGNTLGGGNNSDRVYIRQVPGDGNCLFHSITVALALVGNSTHIDMVGRGNGRDGHSNSNKGRGRFDIDIHDDDYENENERNNENGKKKKKMNMNMNMRAKVKQRKKKEHNRSTISTSTSSQTIGTFGNRNTNTNINTNTGSANINTNDIRHLYRHSRYLREAAVDVLSNNPRRLLFLQGNEYLRARDLVNAAAAQYDLTGEEYCDLMRKESYWGGGPEIVALCNFLKRPIHVYELSGNGAVHDDNDDESSVNSNENYNDDDGEIVHAMEVDGSRDQNDSLDDGQEGSDSKNNVHKKRLGSTTTSSSISKKKKQRKNYLRGCDGVVDDIIETNHQFRLRRMACFGSPKFDRKEPLHILSADSRFPDVAPGEQLSSGNHFMVIFPEDLIQTVNKEKKRMKRRKRSARVRGGGGGVKVKVDLNSGSESGSERASERHSAIYENGEKEKGQKVMVDDGAELSSGSNNINCSTRQIRRKDNSFDNSGHGTKSTTSRAISNWGMHHSIWTKGIIGLCQSFVRWLLCLF